ncbi:MAG TPA: TRAM domain-containing protein [Polyangia bacterium]|nr:TRAM domain-containing protein [Polyangia bacterium]
MQEVTIEIDGLAPGGDAVGRQRDPRGASGPNDGRATFVPLAAPGERVRARLEREKARVAWAELVAIERPSPDRVAPVCPLFGACGGCQWQHVSIDVQRDAKRRIVERALGTPIVAIAPAGPVFGYRDRAKLTVGSGGRLGFHARRSHEIVDVTSCPLLGPELARALPALRRLAGGLTAGTELDVQAGAEGVHVNLVQADAKAAAAHARSEIDRLEAAGVVGLSLAGKPTLGRAEVDVAEPGGAPLAIPAGGFAQVGRAANAALVAAVREAVGPSPGAVGELYAGSGNFTRRLLSVATAVYASDGDAAARSRGARNAPGAIWSARPAAVAVDTVLLDPPREGADRLHLEAARRARHRIVYVSCDPQTLGRDARALAAGGFHLTQAIALDLMPQTFHVEVVAIFERISDRISA